MTRFTLKCKKIGIEFFDLNSFLAQLLLHLLITFANSLDPNQADIQTSGSKLFDTLIVFLKEFYERVNFEKANRGQHKHEK